MDPIFSLLLPVSVLPATVFGKEIPADGEGMLYSTFRMKIPHIWRVMSGDKNIHLSIRANRTVLLMYLTRKAQLKLSEQSYLKVNNAGCHL
jgi:hypothetical protein